MYRGGPIASDVVEFRCYAGGPAVDAAGFRNNKGSISMRVSQREFAQAGLGAGVLDALGGDISAQERLPK